MTRSHLNKTRDDPSALLRQLWLEWNCYYHINFCVPEYPEYCVCVSCTAPFILNIVFGYPAQPSPFLTKTTFTETISFLFRSVYMNPLTRVPLLSRLLSVSPDAYRSFQNRGFIGSLSNEPKCCVTVSTVTKCSKEVPFTTWITCKYYYALKFSPLNPNELVIRVHKYWMHYQCHDQHRIARPDLGTHCDHPEGPSAHCRGGKWWW